MDFVAAGPVMANGLVKRDLAVVMNRKNAFDDDRGFRVLPGKSVTDRHLFRALAFRRIDAVDRWRLDAMHFCEPGQ